MRSGEQKFDWVSWYGYQQQRRLTIVRDAEPGSLESGKRMPRKPLNPWVRVSTQLNMRTARPSRLANHCWSRSMSPRGRPTFLSDKAGSTPSTLSTYPSQ
jgi:hypothetical protein